MEPERAHVRRAHYRVAHAAWAAVCIVCCLLLVLTGRTGHPPAIILLPVVLLAWAMGHGFIWGVQRLADKGRRTVAPTATDGQRWPLALRLTAIGTGSATLVGVTQIVGTLLKGDWYPFGHASAWWAMLVVWAVHAACFAGLLLRRRWSRLLSATLAFGWAALLGFQVVEHLAPGASPDTAGMGIAIGLMVMLVLLGCYLASSGKVRSFLSH
jgi:hypothetical protein